MIGTSLVRSWHRDVQQDHREVAGEQRLERLVAGAGADQLMVEDAENRLQREEVLRTVVDHQDACHPTNLVGSVGLGHAAAAG